LRQLLPVSPREIEEIEALMKQKGIGGFPIE
jgi:hypothetical protein